MRIKTTCKNWREQGKAPCFVKKEDRKNNKKHKGIQEWPN
jgi:hypothetical protein